MTVVLLYFKNRNSTQYCSSTLTYSIILVTFVRMYQIFICGKLFGFQMYNRRRCCCLWVSGGRVNTCWSVCNGMFVQLRVDILRVCVCVPFYTCSPLLWSPSSWPLALWLITYMVKASEILPNRKKRENPIQLKSNTSLGVVQVLKKRL